jgi:hypothetical protein
VDDNSNSNGMNGHFEMVDIDVTNDVAFRTGVVKYLQKISDQTGAIPDLKKKVERHDRIVQYGKWTGVPIMALISMLVKSLLTKLGL